MSVNDDNFMLWDFSYSFKLFVKSCSLVFLSVTLFIKLITAMARMPLRGLFSDNRGDVSNT